MLNNHKPAPLNPGIETALRELMEVPSLKKELVYMFDSFVGTEEFIALKKLERQNFSFAFHRLTDFIDVVFGCDGKGVTL